MKTFEEGSAKGSTYLKKKKKKKDLTTFIYV